jgi:hypothetical protein
MLLLNSVPYKSFSWHLVHWNNITGEEEIISNATDKLTNYLSVLNVSCMASQIKQESIDKIVSGTQQIGLQYSCNDNKQCLWGGTISFMFRRGIIC